MSHKLGILEFSIHSAFEKCLIHISHFQFKGVFFKASGNFNSGLFNNPGEIGFVRT